MLADAFLVFSRSKHEGSALRAACADPSADAMAIFWEQCQAILRREIEVCAGLVCSICAFEAVWCGSRISRQRFQLQEAAGTVLRPPAPACQLTHPLVCLPRLLVPYPLQMKEQDDDASAIALNMAAHRSAATKAAQLAVFQAVPQHAWLAAQLVSQWVGPEAAVSEGAVRRWAPVAEVVKESCRWASGWQGGDGGIKGVAKKGHSGKRRCWC